MFERFTTEARGVVVAAQEHARALRHDWIGTEHILLALIAGQGVGAIVLRGLGVEQERARALILTLLGHDGPGACTATGAPLGPDPRALESIGIDLDAVRRRVEETFGPGALERTSAARRRTGRRSGHIPFTRRAKSLLERSLRESLALRHNYIGSEHILLALISDPRSLGARVLATLGIEAETVRRRVRSTLEGEADSA